MTEQPDTKRIDLKTTQVAAGSLASVTAAVAASQLGVAGTLVGAGVGSVVGTVAGAVYEHYLDRTHHHVRIVVPRPTADIQSTTVATATATAPLDAPVASPEQGQPTWAWLRSHRLGLALSAAAAAGIAIVALTGFEAVRGQPVSAGSGDNGTSVGQFFGGATTDSGADPTPTPSPESSAGDEATSTPTPTPTTATQPAATPQPGTPSTSPTTEAVPEPAAPNLG
jgi:hypothetical protein